MNRQPRYFTPKPLIPRLVRWWYTAMFAVICLLGAYYLLVYAPTVRGSGSLAPTTTQFVPQRDGEETVYITEHQQLRLNLYGAAFAISLLVWLMVGILLEVKLKIHIFKGVPAPLPREPEHSPPTPFSSN
jgi:hypothetical protein